MTLKLLVPFALAAALALAGCLTVPGADDEAADGDRVDEMPQEPQQPRDDAAGADDDDAAGANDEENEAPTEDPGANDDDVVIPIMPETWWILFTESAGSGCGDHILSLTFSPGSSGCRYGDSPLHPVYDVAGFSYWLTFAADTPTSGFPAGTPVSGTVFVELIGATIGNVTVELVAGDDVVASVTMPMEPAPGTGETQNITFEMETTQAIASGAELEFRLAQNTPTLVSIISTEEHPSAFTIGAMG